MKTFAVFALLAVAAYANLVDPPVETPDIVDEHKTIEKRQVDTDPKAEPDVHIIITDREPKREKRQAETDPKAEVKPVDEPHVEVVKRQAETDPKAEIEPDVHIIVTDREPKREKRDTDEDDDDSSSSEERFDVNGSPIILLPQPDIQPETPFQNQPIAILPEGSFHQKRHAETDPKDEIKPVEETEHHVVKRSTHEDDDSSSSQEQELAVDANGNPIILVDQPDTQMKKRHVETANATRTRRFIEHEHDENPYPDCSCNQKHPRLPLYTKLHAHCKYPGGKPRPPCNTCGHPHPHPPCSSCGHGHCPKAPCHGHGHGSVYHHHHVHVVPHAPVRVHHDVHHHFVPKRPHYRAPCDRSHDYDHDEHEYKH